MVNYVITEIFQRLISYWCEIMKGNNRQLLFSFVFTFVAIFSRRIDYSLSSVQIFHSLFMQLPTNYHDSSFCSFLGSIKKKKTKKRILVYLWMPFPIYSTFRLLDSFLIWLLLTDNNGMKDGMNSRNGRNTSFCVNYKLFTYYSYL